MSVIAPDGRRIMLFKANAQAINATELRLRKPEPASQARPCRPGTCLKVTHMSRTMAKVVATAASVWLVQQMFLETHAR
jgi:hypothetical protein